MASIKASSGELSDKSEAKAVRALLEAALADLTALRAAHLALTAKLDADGGVTDVNYASTTNPAALTLTA
jgi:hypothetical protein